MSPRNQNVPLVESQHHVINPTNPRRALDDGVEDRLHVRGRAADDAEHLGRCRLMLQGLAQFCVALLDFLEQPHVFDGDHRLVGEGFKQFDLPVGERTDFIAANHRSLRSEHLLAKQGRRQVASPNSHRCAEPGHLGNLFQTRQGRAHGSFAGRGWLDRRGRHDSMGRSTYYPGPALTHNCATL